MHSTLHEKTKITFNAVTIQWSYGSICDFLLKASNGCVFYVDWGDGKSTQQIGKEAIVKLRHDYAPRTIIPKDETVYRIEIFSEDENCLFTLLDVSHCEMRFADINVSRCTELEVLVCKWNDITTLDLQKNTALLELNCSQNHLTTLDLRKNATLRVLDCEYNGLVNLQIGNCANLKEMHCIEGNKLKEPTKRWVERLTIGNAGEID